MMLRGFEVFFEILRRSARSRYALENKFREISYGEAQLEHSNRS